MNAARAISGRYASVAIGIYERRERRGSSPAMARGETALVLSALSMIQIGIALSMFGWRPKSQPIMIWVNVFLLLAVLELAHLSVLRSWLEVDRQSLGDPRARARWSNVYVIGTLLLFVAALTAFALR